MSLIHTVSLTEVLKIQECEYTMASWWHGRRRLYLRIPTGRYAHSARVQPRSRHRYSLLPIHISHEIDIRVQYPLASMQLLVITSGAVLSRLLVLLT